MQSYIEVDEEDLYTLKINCKGKRTVGKTKEMYKIYNRFKKLIIKIIKKRKEKNGRRKKKNGRRKRKGKKKGKVPGLQKPNTEAEVYNNNKKCD